MPAGPVTIYDFEFNLSILLLPDIYESLSSCKGHYDQSHLTRQDTFDVTDKTGSIRKISIHIGFPCIFLCYTTPSYICNRNNACMSSYYS